MLRKSKILSKKGLVAAAFLLISTLAQGSSFPQLGGLVLPGEKGVAHFEGYRCEAYGELVTAPKFFSQKLGMEPQGLAFDSEGRYHLLRIFFGTALACAADIRLENSLENSLEKGFFSHVETRRYFRYGSPTCDGGEQMLKLFREEGGNKVSFWEGDDRRSHFTFFVHSGEAGEICGRGETHIGLDFTF